MLDPRRAGAVLAAITWLLASGASAYDEDAPHAFRHAEPGTFDYYVLVLGWSPTYCLKEGDERGDPQCDTERSHDFVLHGLWPQYANGWPEDCYRGKRPWVPSQVIGEMRDIMPSKELVIHEYGPRHLLGPRPRAVLRRGPRPLRPGDRTGPVRRSGNSTLPLARNGRT